MTSMISPAWIVTAIFFPPLESIARVVSLRRKRLPVNMDLVQYTVGTHYPLTPSIRRAPLGADDNRFEAKSSCTAPSFFGFVARRCFLFSILGKQLQSCLAVFECVFSTVPVHRSQHPSQVGHCGVDLSRSGWEQIRLSASRFVQASYRARYLFQDGYSGGKQSGMVFPLGIILATKPLDDVLEIGPACWVQHVLWYCANSAETGSSAICFLLEGSSATVKITSASGFGSAPVGIGEEPDKTFSHPAETLY